MSRLPPLITLLKSCKTLRCFQQIHVHLIRKGLEDDNYLISAFISHSSTISSSLLPYATAVFSQVSFASTCLWNSLLKFYSLSSSSSLSSSLSLFSAMRASSCGSECDKYTFPPLIKCCANELAPFAGFYLHGLCVKYGVDDDVFVCSSLIHFYGKCNLIADAQKVFDAMSIRNVVSWTSLVVGYVHSGDLVNARRVFDAMPKRNIVSWNAMISGYVKLGEFDSARKMFDDMPSKNVFSYTTMIDGYAKCGKMEVARDLFEECLVKDLFLWSTLISGYTKNGLPNEAIKSFWEMLSSNTRPDDHIMVSVMSACAQLEHSDMAREIDRYMSRHSFDLHSTHVVAALVDMNAKCGNIEKAIMLFNGLPKRDLISYCSMIQGLSMHGKGEDAVKLFYNMISEGLIPDEVAFTVILTACNQYELVEEGYKLFEMMRSIYSITPSSDHYICLIDLLGRSGQLEVAYDVLKSLPIEAHTEAWGALLGACRLHCDTKLAAVVDNRLVELELQNAATLVLLSNIYASADRWLDVSLVRNRMVDCGLQKIPGRSWF